jgi:pilus assembly protein Flp/PilA
MSCDRRAVAGTALGLSAPSARFAGRRVDGAGLPAFGGGSSSRGVIDMQGLQHVIIAARAWLVCWRDDERGATAVEYGLIVALIAAVVISGVAFLGTRTRDGFNAVTVNYPT